ncbi:MAG: NUDIX hydrolase [Pseudozobellia sp.]|nr:NUDIX hydrolase [Pseudozobellia sp.]MBG48775.1 NUDIX hydrolase [Pseudozobellia sp.]|tara:strand:+ start:10 stop:744 length:735 start_codon:yes stop_codon:yes gene_type:complete
MRIYEADELISQLSIDCTIFGYQEKRLKVLISQLNFKGDFLALPAGFVYQNESIDQSAHRILTERTGLKDIYLQQFWVFGEKDRNYSKFMGQLFAFNPELKPNDEMGNERLTWFSKRFISIGYYALVDINKVQLNKSGLDHSLEWYNFNELPDLIFDHNEQTSKAYRALQLHLDENLLGFNLLPEKFTMKEIQQVYEAVYDRPFRRNNFQKKMLDLGVLERLEKKYTGANNKAPYFYRLKPSTP